MDRRKKATFISGVVLWGIFVMGLVIYLFFPYQKTLKIALQNVIGGGRTAVSMEGVTTKFMGINAAKILFRPEAGTGAAAPFELSRVSITWNPLSLLRGKLTIYSHAVLYDGKVSCTVTGIPVAGSSNPDVLVKLEGVNIAKSPEGTMKWFKGMTGILDGTIKRQVSVSQPDKYTGSFRLNLRKGEIRDLQVKNMPRLVIPYRQIALEGKMDGARVDLSKIAVTSDIISLSGGGSITTGDADKVDIKLAYNVLSQTLPLKGSGTLQVSGSQAAPEIAVSAPQTTTAPGTK